MIKSAIYSSREIADFNKLDIRSAKIIRFDFCYTGRADEILSFDILFKDDIGEQSLAVRPLGVQGACFLDLPNYMAFFLDQVFGVTGVRNTRHLRNKIVKVGRDGWNGTIILIGNEVTDNWFDLRKLDNCLEENDA